MYEMVNKCVIYGCKSGYVTKAEKENKVSSFFFPFHKPDLLSKWIKFINHSEWTPTSNSVICIKYIKEELIIEGKRKTFNWNLDPVPTIHTSVSLERPSTLSTTSTSRKPPKVRIYQKDELTLLEKQDKIEDFNDINANHALANYLFHKSLEFVVFYNLKFFLSSFPKIYGAIKSHNNHINF